MYDENTLEFPEPDDTQPFSAEADIRFRRDPLVPKNRSRAQRRRTRKHLQHARKNFWGRDLDRTQLGKVVDTPKPHTCAGCGNPRKYHGELSMKERRSCQRERLIETEVGSTSNDDKRGAQRSPA